MLVIDKRIELFEAVAATQLATVLDNSIVSQGEQSHEVRDYLQTFLPADIDVELKPLEFDKAYRAVDSSKESYISVLAAESKMTLPETGVQGIIKDSQEKGNHIVLCPFSIRPEMGLPYVVWGAVVKLLRSYGLPVYQMAERGQRMDGLGFFENEILSEFTMERKLNILHTAKLVIGTSSVWSWIAAESGRQQLIVYPENIPIKRWYPYPGAVLQYRMNEIQIPTVIVGIKKLLQRAE